MSNYTKEELKKRAQITINAIKENDPRAELLIMMLSISFGISQSECISRIKEIAK